MRWSDHALPTRWASPLGIADGQVFDPIRRVVRTRREKGA